MINSNNDNIVDVKLYAWKHKINLHIEYKTSNLDLDISVCISKYLYTNTYIVNANLRKCKNAKKKNKM